MGSFLRFLAEDVLFWIRPGAVLLVAGVLVWLWASGRLAKSRPFGCDPFVFWSSLAFGFLLAGITFCLGYFLLAMQLWLATVIGAAVGVTQTAGILWFIRSRFKGPGKPPAGGGHH